MATSPLSWRVRAAVAIVAAAGLMACTPPQVPSADPPAGGTKHLTKAQRLADIARAQVWTPTDVAAMDLRTGPPGKGAVAPLATVSCEYVDRKLSGSSPKFACALSPDDEVKIKYGADNPEVFGVVLASRLLWALGFGADRWYPVTVICHRCPDDPHHDRKPTTHDVTFGAAALERKEAGKEIETHPDEGWAWPELDLVRPDLGGAPQTQRDALKLLAVFMQHTDSKPEQQRIVCQGKTDEAGICAQPFMFVHDVGLTFGKANLTNANVTSGVNLKDWSKEPIWRDQAYCVGNLHRSFTGTLDNPVISESGRKFLAALLMQLSDRQLRDLFEVARVPEYSHASVDDWIAAFKAKRAVIASTTCPS